VANAIKHLIELVSLRAVAPEHLNQLRDGESVVLLLGEMRSSGADDRRPNLERTYQSVYCPLLSFKCLPRRSSVTYETGDEEYYVRK
jgi:hypothetical protein